MTEKQQSVCTNKLERGPILVDACHFYLLRSEERKLEESREAKSYFKTQNMSENRQSLWWKLILSQASRLSITRPSASAARRNRQGGLRRVQILIACNCVTTLYQFMNICEAIECDTQQSTRRETDHVVKGLVGRINLMALSQIFNCKSMQLCDFSYLETRSIQTENSNDFHYLALEMSKVDGMRMVCSSGGTVVAS